MRKNAEERRISAIVPAAGKGTRFRSKKKKIFAKLKQRPILFHSLKALQNCSLINEIVLVIEEPFHDAAKRLVKRYRLTKVSYIVKGGKTRTDSVRNGLNRVGKDASFILVHDGARPLVNEKLIRRTIAAAVKFGASVAALPVKATIKVAGENDLVKYTPDRRNLWEAQTPQVFRKNLMEKAYGKVKGQRAGGRKCFTDDAALLENIGTKVKIVSGDYENIKITTTEDINIAEALLYKRKK